MASLTQPVRVVIVGGGFGGVYTAHNLEQLGRQRAGLQVTLVSRNNYLLITPLLFEASSGILEPRHAVQPLRQMLRQTRFVEGEVERIDFERRLVLVRPGPDELVELPYEHLVMAVGGISDITRVPGSEYAITFKTLADAIFLRNYIIELFERAEVESDPQRQQAMLTFVVIGGGLVGIELLGELTAFTRNLARYYPHIHPGQMRFELLEAGPRILKEMDEDLAGYAAQVLRGRGVVLRTACLAGRVEPGCVHLSDGQTIGARTTILATGVAPNPLLKDLTLEKDHKGRIAVDGAMRSRSHPDVWALGDCASIPDPGGQPYPQLAQHALREARVLAENILGVLDGRPPRPFVYQTLGTLAALGHYQGVGRIRQVKLKGFPAWWLWRTYYLWQMPRWERRLRIALDWTVALFFRNDCAKLDLFGEQHPLRRYERRWLGEVIEQPPSPP